MIALLQRVSSASIKVEGEVIAAVDQGLLVFIAIESDDDEPRAERMLERLLGYRVFADATGKMNLSLLDIQGGLLLVPQFTLAADTRKGMRPSFTPAAAPVKGEALFDFLVQTARHLYAQVETGRFGADMQVTLVNDGPVTFMLRTPNG